MGWNQNTRRNDEKQLSSQIRIQIAKVAEVSNCPVFSRSHVPIVFKSTYLCIQPAHLHCNWSGPTSRTWRQTAPPLLVLFVPLVQKVPQYLLFHLDQCLLKKFHFSCFFIIISVFSLRYWRRGFKLGQSYLATPQNCTKMLRNLTFAVLLAIFLNQTKQRKRAQQ